MSVVVLFGLSLLSLAFGAEWPVPPSGQPAQMSSRINYDPRLTDPFFKSNEWSYPDYNLEGIPLDKRPKKPPRLRHTAKCFSNSFGADHEVRFCEARFLDVNKIDLFIRESNPGFDDRLIIQIRNGMFTCQYWTLYRAVPKVGLMWTTKRQELTLNKKTYGKGDGIKGRIDFECVEEPTDPKYIEKYGKSPTTIKAYGVFKTIVK